MKEKFQDAFIEFFMPLVILYRYITATKGTKMISIERPWKNSPFKSADLDSPKQNS